MDKEIYIKINKIASVLVSEKKMLATVESCTGGLIAAFCTDIAGSSAWFYGGVVAYDNQAKMDLLKVNEQTLADYGAVSKQTVKEMCRGALRLPKVDCVIAVSGVAGPGGGTNTNPVGSVWIGVQIKGGKAQIKKYFFHGNRQQIRKQTVLQGLENLLLLLEQSIG